MSFSTKLYELRAAKGISQKELADALGVAQSSINYWEKGQRDPSITIAQKVADFFNITIDEMIGWDPQKTVGENIDNLKEDSEPRTIAAHFDGNDFTEEELEQIKKFAAFVKSQRQLSKGVSYDE